MFNQETTNVSQKYDEFSSALGTNLKKDFHGFLFSWKEALLH